MTPEQQHWLTEMQVQHGVTILVQQPLSMAVPAPLLIRLQWPTGLETVHVLMRDGDTL